MRSNTDFKLETVGKELERLISLFNSGLHANIVKKFWSKDLKKLTIGINDVINIDLNSIRKPYLAYQENFLEFYMSV